MTCGVYKIWIGDYYYFGSSIGCEGRCNGHFKSLKRDNHSNEKMQSVYNKHHAFDYQIIVECDSREAAYAYEQDFIDTHFGLDKCLNLSNQASGGPTGKKIKTNPPRWKTTMSRPPKQRATKGVSTGHLPKSQCPHCLGWFTAGALSRWHGDNCKKKLQQLENNHEFLQNA